MYKSATRREMVGLSIFVFTTPMTRNGLPAYVRSCMRVRIGLVGRPILFHIAVLMTHLVTRLDQAVIKPLVISFLVIMKKVLANGIA